jgi:hypothetical protein
MPDNTIPRGKPGVAEFSSETWGNAKEFRLQDTPALAVKSYTITAGGSDLDLPLYSVVATNGLATRTGNNAIGILPMPLSIPAGQSLTVDVIVAGHYDYEALVFDASYVTDAQKKAAFDGRPAPVNIILGTNPYNSDGVLA